MKFIILSTLVFALLGIVPSVQATSYVTDLEVENNIVTFSLSAEKTHTSPGCVDQEQLQKWNMSLLTPRGKAAYTLLVTAVSNGLSVKTQSANDCALIPGIERAGRIWLED